MCIRLPQSNAVISLIVHLFVVYHCCRSRSWGTSWYLGVRSNLGAVLRPQASPRTAGIPKSGAGHWKMTPRSSGSDHHKHKNTSTFSPRFLYTYHERSNKVNTCTFFNLNSSRFIVIISYSYRIWCVLPQPIGQSSLTSGLLFCPALT